MLSHDSGEDNLGVCCRTVLPSSLVTKFCYSASKVFVSVVPASCRRTLGELAEFLEEVKLWLATPSFAGVHLL